MTAPSSSAAYFCRFSMRPPSLLPLSAFTQQSQPSYTQEALASDLFLPQSGKQAAREHLRLTIVLVNLCLYLYLCLYLRLYLCLHLYLFLYLHLYEMSMRNSQQAAHASRAKVEKLVKMDFRSTDQQSSYMSVVRFPVFVFVFVIVFEHRSSLADVRTN